LATSVIVIPLTAPGADVLCRIDFTVKFGTATVRGAEPLATPKRGVLGFVMATLRMLPTEPSLCKIKACMRTDGDSCSVAAFVKENVTTHLVAAVIPPDAAVSTSSPRSFVHAPTIPNKLDVDVTAMLASVVCEPISPDIVTVEFAARS